MRWLVNFILNTGLIVLSCVVLSGCGSVGGQGPDRPASANSSQMQKSNGVPPDAKEGGIEQWRSCAQGLHRGGGYQASEIRAMFEPPQNVPQLLQNLKIAADRGLLLQPSFYEESLLLQFFNGSAVTWTGPGRYYANTHPTGHFNVSIASDAFPKLAITLEGNCRLLKTNVALGATIDDTANAFLDIALDTDGGVTLADVKSAFGLDGFPYRDNEVHPDENPYVRPVKGIVTYENGRFDGRDHFHVGTVFYIKRNRSLSFEDGDEVAKIEIQDDQYHTLEDR